MKIHYPNTINYFELLQSKKNIYIQKDGIVYFENS